MSYIFQTISHPTSDTNRPTVSIRDNSDGSLHIVGKIPEGFQRKCNELGIKTSKTENLFLTGILDWNSIAGLPGFILTVSDQGLEKLGIYHSGNRMLSYMISIWRYFVFRFGIDLKALDLEPHKDISYHKKNYTMRAVNIKANDANDTTIMDDSLFNKFENLVQLIFPKTINAYSYKNISKISIPTSQIKNPRISTNYIFQGSSVRGKFLVNEAKRLGCEIKHFKTLCDFKPVTLDNGTIIEPEQVLEKTRHFRPVLFLDIPNLDYIENTINYNWIAEVEQPYIAVYHFLDSSIKDPLSNEKYVNFIKSFPESCTHFISHKSYTPDSINFIKSLTISLKWRSILGDMFPLPFWSNEPQLSIPEVLKDRNVVPLMTNQAFQFQAGTDYWTPITENPNSTSELEKVIDNHDKFVDDFYEKELIPLNIDFIPKKEFVTRKEELLQLRNDLVDEEEEIVDKVETIILGTGSAIPSLVRNVVSNVLRVPYITKQGSLEYRTVILDAGENSLGALNRLLKNDSDQKRKFFQELKLIYLSHLHADHHLGISSIISEWNKYQDELPEVQRSKLYIVTPWLYNKFMHELNKVEELSNFSNIEYLSCDEFLHNNNAVGEFGQIDIQDIPATQFTKEIKTDAIQFKRNPAKVQQFFDDLNLNNFETYYTFHCDYAYLCSISFRLFEDMTSPLADKKQKVFKVSYSGDTRPVASFKKIGKDSDLLIHEATLEDSKLKDAIDKRHSTFSEAIHVAMLMGAKKLLLTHFSQRYPSVDFESIHSRLDGKSLDVDYSKFPPYKDSERTFDKPRFANYNTSNTNNNIVHEISEEENLPIELASHIFRTKLTPEEIDKAKKMEVIVAFDNMFFKYSEMYKQMEIAMNEGKNKLDALFSKEINELDKFEDLEVKENDKKSQSRGKDTNCKTKKSKKQKTVS